jgi:hypothetical protein
MGRRHNLAAVRTAAWSTPPPAPAPVAPEQKVLRVLYRERERVSARIALIEKLLEDRDRLGEQVTTLREFSERVMDDVELKTEKVHQLTRTLEEKDARLLAVEQAQQVQEARLAQLEATLKMLSEAEETMVEGSQGPLSGDAEGNGSPKA